MNVQEQQPVLSDEWLVDSEEGKTEEVVSSEVENKRTRRYDRSTYSRPIDFWDDFEELELFVTQVAYKQMRRMNFSRMEKALHGLDCTQVAWLTLLDVRSREPDIVKGEASAKMKNHVRAYILKYVFNLIRMKRVNGKYTFTKLFHAWQLSEIEQSEAFWEAYDLEEVEERGEAIVTPSPLPEEAMIAAEEAALAAAQAEVEMEQRVESTFLFHQIGRTIDRTDLHDGDYPGFEEALVLLLCAKQLHSRPNHPLDMEMKRQYARVFVRRMQGGSRKEIAAEMGITESKVKGMISYGKKHLQVWHSLSYAEQVELIAKAKLTYPELA